MTADDDPGFAPAKINLTLHLAGRRADGYHLLTSLVVFAGVGDSVRFAPADTLTLAIDGPFGGGLDSKDNLILRAATALATHHARPPGADFTLTKELPVASGIGGGSSDAAAALRLLADAWDVDIPDDLAVRLGADVPVCLRAPAPQLMSGIGEILTPVPTVPDCWLVLVNPGVGVATGPVFARVRDRNPPPGPPLTDRDLTDFDSFVSWLTAQRNDLQAPAQEICPEISQVLAALSPAPVARMSGSGATCFGLMPDRQSATQLADTIRQTTGWWVAAAPVLGSKV